MYTYIVIDDERLIREGTIKKLSHMNDLISCIGQAENGKEGLELIKNLNPDIVILDMQMPVMDGNEFLAIVSKQYPDIALIAISGYRNFDYIKNAVDAKALNYLLKPFSRQEIEEVLYQAIDKIKNNASYKDLLCKEEHNVTTYLNHDIQIFQSLVLGYPADDIVLHSDHLSFMINAHNFVLITLSNAVNCSIEIIREFLEQNNYSEFTLAIPHLNNESLILLFLFIPPDNSSLINKLVSELCASLSQWLNHYNKPSLFGISNMYTSLSDSHHAFLETVQALNQQRITQNDHIFFFYSDQFTLQSIDWSSQEEFLFRIEAGMQEEVTTLLENLFHYYTTLPNFTLADVKYHCYQLVRECRHIIAIYIPQVCTADDSTSMQNIVNNLFTLEDLQQYYIQFFSNITQIIKSNSVYTTGNTIDQIQVYIQRNYNKNLTGELISSLFYLNRTYLSTRFKEQTGIKFVDYLNQIRIEKSKELLKDSNRKLYQVAKMVGYDNVKYFFRVFKKFTGTTPDEWRKTHS